MERETGNQWDTLVVRRDEELRGIVGIVRELLDAEVDVYLAINNHYEGCAPMAIERIADLMRRGEPGDGE